MRQLTSDEIKRQIDHNQEAEKDLIIHYLINPALCERQAKEVLLVLRAAGKMFMSSLLAIAMMRLNTQITIKLKGKAFTLADGNNPLMKLIHQKDEGKWYFWNETWTGEEGPFETEIACRKALDKYAKENAEPSGD